MEPEDKQSLAQFLLMITSALISYGISVNLQGTTLFQLSVIIFVIIFAFIAYTSLIGRPWPRSYYKIIECNGTESDINSFFWIFYDDFESTFKKYFLHEIAELNPTEDYPHLLLENNKIKVESENKKTLELTCNLIKDLYELNGLENIQIGNLNFQSKYIARIKMNNQFRASTTNMIFATKLNLNKLDVRGIYNTSNILNLDVEKDNGVTLFSWSEEKDFLHIKNQSQNKYGGVFDVVKRLFNDSDTPNYPIILRRQLSLDEINNQLVYYVTIDAKWTIPYTKSIALFKDAIENFYEFLDVWNNTNSEAGVKYRFKNCAFSGLVIKDGIISKKYAKKLILFSGRDIE